LLLQTQIATRDAIIEMFLKRMARIHTLGKEALELLHQQYRATTEHLLSVFTDVLHTAQELADDATFGKQVREVLEEEEGGVQGLLEKTEKLTSYNGNNYFPLLWQFYHSLCTYCAFSLWPSFTRISAQSRSLTLAKMKPPPQSADPHSLEGVPLIRG
jgi:hypothetical protein